LPARDRHQPGGGALRRGAAQLAPARGQHWFAPGAGTAAALRRAGVGACTTRCVGAGAEPCWTIRCCSRCAARAWACSPRRAARTLLEDLRARGAKLLLAAVYRREPLRRPAARLRALARAAGAQRLLLSSGEAAGFAVAHPRRRWRAALRRRTCVASSARLAAQARALGLRAPLLARRARPERTAGLHSPRMRPHSVSMPALARVADRDRPPAPPASRRSGALWVLLAIAALLAALFAWKTWTSRSARRARTRRATSAPKRWTRACSRSRSAQENARRTQVAQEQRLVDTRARTGLLRDEVLALTQRASLLEDSVREAAQGSRDGVAALRLDEVELLLTIAQQRLQLSGDLAGAIRASELADGVLSTQRDPELVDLRRRWRRNWPRCARCRCAARGRRGELDALESTLPRLRGGDALGRRARAGRRARNTGCSGLLDSLVQVRRTGGQDLLSPADRGAAETALALDIGLARSALASGEQATFRRALARIDGWLQRLYADGPLLRERRAHLARLRTLELGYQLPIAGATLRQLQALRPRAPAGAVSAFRTLLWWLLLAALGALAYELLARDLGEVVLRWHGITLTTTVAFALLAWGLLWFLSGCCGRCCACLSPPGSGWRRRRRASAWSTAWWRCTKAATRAPPHLLGKAAEDAEIATIARIAAREASLRRGDAAGAAQWQAALSEREPLLAAINGAESLLAQGAAKSALELLQPWHERQALPPRGLRLRGMALLASGRAAEALPLLPLLAREAETAPMRRPRASAIGTPPRWRSRRTRANCSSVGRRWARRSASRPPLLRPTPRVPANSDSRRSGARARGGDRARWDEALLPAYAASAGRRARARLARAQSWLPRTRTARARARARPPRLRADELGKAEEMLTRAHGAGRRRAGLGRTRQPVTPRARIRRAAQISYANALRVGRGTGRRCRWAAAACANRSPRRPSPSSATNWATPAFSVRGWRRRPCRRRCRSRSARGRCRAPRAASPRWRRCARRWRRRDGRPRARNRPRSISRGRCCPAAPTGRGDRGSSRPIPRPSACTAPAPRRLRGFRRNRSPAGSGPRRCSSCATATVGAISRPSPRSKSTAATCASTSQACTGRLCACAHSSRRAAPRRRHRTGWSNCRR
jgi:uncharacterized protein HemX